MDPSALLTELEPWLSVIGSLCVIVGTVFVVQLRMSRLPPLRPARSTAPRGTKGPAPSGQVIAGITSSQRSIPVPADLRNANERNSSSSRSEGVPASSQTISTLAEPAALASTVP